MEKRTISVELRANVADFKQQMRSASTSLEEAVKKMDKTGKVADTRMGRLAQSAMYQRDAWSQAGTALLGFGAATVGGLGLAAKAAIDWEAAWTGVTKTVDGSAEEMNQLEAELRSLALQLPSTHEEIAGVAEAAGQLGVRVGDIKSFTKTMIDLGETTNLSAEQAATGIARLYNIMGLSNSDARKFGNVIVDLGNNFATTESEILDFSLRMAAAGRQAGLSAADVAAYSAALSSVGVEAEAGGTAMSKVFTGIGDAVRSGGKELETYSRLAGVSASEFKKLFGDDSAQAIAKVVSGFGALSKEGENTSAVFKELKLNDERLKRSILSMGQSVDSTLLPALERANTAWEKGGALSAEASKRYATDQARLKMAMNEIKDAGISIGADLAPVVATVAQGLGSLVHAFTELPGPVKTGTVALAGMIGTTALVGGAMLKFIPIAIEMGKALQSLGVISAITDSRLGRMGKRMAGGKLAGAKGEVLGSVVRFIPPVLATIAVANGLKYVIDAIKGVEYIDDSLETVTNRIAAASEGASQFDVILGDLRESGQVVGYEMGSLSDVLDQINHKSWLTSFLVDILNVDPGDGIQYVEERFSNLSQVMATMAETDAPRAQKQFKALVDELGGGAKAADELFTAMPEYHKAIMDQASAAGLAADSETLLKIATGELNVVVDEATGKAETFSKSQEEIDRISGKLYDQFGRLAPATKEAGEEVRKYEESLRALTDIDISKNADKGLKTWIKSLQEQRKAVEEWQTNMLALSSSDLSQTALDAIAKLGPEAGGRIAKELTQAMNDKAKFSKLTQTLESTIGEGALKSGNYFSKTFASATEGADAKAVLKAAFDKLGTDGVRQVQEKFASGMSAWQINDELKLGLRLDSTPADQALEQLKDRVLAANPVVTIGGQSLPAQQALKTVLAAIEQGQSSVTIGGKTLPAEQALAAIIQEVYRADPAMTVHAATGLATDMITSLKTYAKQGTSFNVNSQIGNDPVSGWKNKLGKGISFVANALIRVGNISHVPLDVTARATGGPIIGPGTGTSDSILARLSNGEHVLTAEEVRKAGGHGEIERLRRMIRTGHRYATGGAVGRINPSRYLTPAQAQQLNIWVTNPFTGEQVRAHARAEAINQVLEGQKY